MEAKDFSVNLKRSFRLMNSHRTGGCDAPVAAFPESEPDCRAAMWVGCE
jgi:hypothetical protein